MNRKAIILNYRTARKINGIRPAVIYLKKNIGKVYLEGQADFIMSIGKDKLYFQRLSLFTKKLLKEKDFTLDLDKIKSYNLRITNPVTNCLTLYTFEKNFIEIFYNIKTPDTYEGEVNISDIIKMLESRGVKEIK